jgi:hypothetical protein
MIHDVDNVNIKHLEIVYWPVGIERIIFGKIAAVLADETREKHAFGLLEYRVLSSCLSCLQ